MDIFLLWKFSFFFFICDYKWNNNISYTYSDKFQCLTKHTIQSLCRIELRLLAFEMNVFFFFHLNGFYMCIITILVYSQLKLIAYRNCS